MVAATAVSDDAGSACDGAARVAVDEVSLCDSSTCSIRKGYLHHFRASHCDSGWVEDGRKCLVERQPLPGTECLGKDI